MTGQQCQKPQEEKPPAQLADNVLELIDCRSRLFRRQANTFRQKKQEKPDIKQPRK